MKAGRIARSKGFAGILLGLGIFVTMLVLNPFRVDQQAALVLAVAALMVTWWVSEAIPMPVVALLPLILFPLTGVSTLRETSASYGDSVIFLFLGGFMIGLAIEKWNLHTRIALNIIRLTGTSGNRIVLGFILATGFLSMWLSNTATTMMMYPIAMSLISVVEENRSGQGNIRNFSLSVMLSIAYASNFGGVATLVGTPPNVAFAGFLNSRYGSTVSFADWILVCAPVALLLLFSLYGVLTRILFPSRLAADPQTQAVIRTRMEALGPLRPPEKRVLIIFACTAALWITRDLINDLGWFRLDDTIIAVIGATALFICPSGGRAGERARILEWPDTSRMAWGILLLFGGGIALAAALENAGLVQQIGEWVAGFSGSGGLMLVLVITIVSMFVSELMSNIAQVIVFSPVIAGIADAMGINPLLLGIPMTLAASCASMMPMGTPPNAIVFASGHIRFSQMMGAGFVMNLIAIFLITLFSWFLIPLVTG